jgi:hypothetical protein
MAAAAIGAVVGGAVGLEGDRAGVKGAAAARNCRRLLIVFHVGVTNVTVAINTTVEIRLYYG